MAEQEPLSRDGPLTKLDLVEGLAGWRRWLVQLLIAAVALSVFLVLRWLVDLWVDGAAPFAPAYVPIILATLAGRLPAGILVWFATMLYGWVAIVPPVGALTFSDPVDVPRTFVNMAVSLVLVLVIDAARRQAAGLVRERDERVRERNMLLAEVDHRLKNNLAILASLFSMQARESASEEAREALAMATSRVHSLARAYEHLRYDTGAIAAADTRPFLEGLCASLREALALDGRIELVADVEPCQVARDRAAALALLVNEIVTNAAKHAFVGRDHGTIALSFSCRGEGALLTIGDDGIGMAGVDDRRGKGRPLLDGLARMSQGRLSCHSGRKGTTYRLELRALP